MKKIFVAFICCTLLNFSQVFAGDDSVEANITRTLCIMFKLSHTHIGAASESGYRQKAILHNGIYLIAFKSDSSGWTGFFKPLSSDDLPEGVPKHIKNIYKGCIIEHVAMYFDSSADVSYFAEISMNGKLIFLKIQPSGRTKVFNCISEQTLNN